MGFFCPGCNFPIMNHMKEDVVSVFVRNGKKEMDTLRVGAIADYDIEVSEATEKYSSVEQIEKANKMMSDDLERDLFERKYFFISECTKMTPEEQAQTGFSVWHLECALKELNVESYVESDVDYKEIELDFVNKDIEEVKKSKNLTEEEKQNKLKSLERSRERILKEIRKLENFEFNIFDNPYLKKKFRHFNKWNQNIISREGGFYGDTLFDTMKNQLLRFWEIMKDKDFGKPVPDNAMSWSPNDLKKNIDPSDYKFHEMIMMLGIPKEVLEDSLSLFEDEYEDED